MENHQTGFAAVNGARLYYEVAGQGPVVVFIHAGVADRRMWDDQFDEFAKQYRVIRYDHRTYGKTENPQGEYDPVQDLAGLLNHLQVESAALVGCSVGGMVATNFTLTHPQKVRALVLSGAALGGYESPNPDADAEFEAEYEAAYGARDFEKVIEMDMTMWLDGPGRKPGSVTGPVRDRMHAMRMTEIQRGEVSRFIPLNPPALGRLGEIAVPTLVIIGESDTPDILAIGDILAKGIPHAKKISYPTVAHMLNMEIPAQFNADVLAFLAQAGLS